MTSKVNSQKLFSSDPLLSDPTSLPPEPDD